MNLNYLYLINYYLMADYFEFKNVFIPSKMYESQINQPDKSNVSTPIFTDDESSGNTTDSSSPGYSDSEGEVFQNIQTTYQLVGIVKKRNYWGEPEWWVVDIYDSEEVKKLDKPGLKGITGLFKYSTNESIPIGSKVQVELTYNAKGYCLWKQNKIISLVKSEN